MLRVLCVQEDALWVSGEPCSSTPAKLTAVPFFVTATKWQLLFFFSSSKQQVCLFMEFFYLQSGTRIQRAWWCLQAWALRVCHARCLLNFTTFVHSQTPQEFLAELVCVLESPEPPSGLISAPSYISVSLHFRICVEKWLARTLGKPKKCTKDVLRMLQQLAWTGVSRPNETEKQRRNRTHAASQTHQWH